VASLGSCRDVLQHVALVFDMADRSDWIATRTCPWCVCGNTHSGGKWNSQPVENKFYFVALRSDWGPRREVLRIVALVARGCGRRSCEGTRPREGKSWWPRIDDGRREFPFFGGTSWQLVWTPRPASPFSSQPYFAHQRRRRCLCRSRNFSRFHGGVT